MTSTWHESYLAARVQSRKSSRRIELDGKFYRKRRGVLVEIPEEWVGKVTHPQTMRKRAAKTNQGRTFKTKAMR